MEATKAVVDTEKKQTPLHPWKSTTHEERYYHFQRDKVPEGVPDVLANTKFKAVTVFARKEQVAHGDSLVPLWFFAIALYVDGDPAPFSRKVGRGLARRKYFAQAYNRYPSPVGVDGGLDMEELMRRVSSRVQAFNHPPGHPAPYKRSGHRG